MPVIVKYRRVIAFTALLGCFMMIGTIKLFVLNRETAAESNTSKEVTIRPVYAQVDSSISDGFSSEIVDLTIDQGQNYFVEYRINREQYRQEKKEMLEPLLKSDMEESRRKAQESWFELCEKISKEEEVENALKIKGYKDVVAEVNTNFACVTVLTERLTQQDYVQIKGVTVEITGFSNAKVEVYEISDANEP